ncbi:selenoprotein S-like [Haliotis rufescens]|uniref:selenoprotein S-like n=1 Tax=Haliotis rufescens TaxID=6454 RepID=UPI00201F841E|nr:selenoprotein S-like [Haliotis rufescens]
MGDAGGEESPQPEVLRNEYPALVTTVFSTGVELIQSYGWFLLAAVLLLLYLRNKFQATWDKMQKSREEESYKKYDVGATQSRLEAMERSRQRMQEQLDAQAEEYTEKQRKKEEEKRKQKIEDWDRHLEGKGYRSKYKPNEDGEEASGHLPKPKPKKPLRQSDYNPLMGGASSGTFRPARRGGAGGGG